MKKSDNAAPGVTVFTFLFGDFFDMMNPDATHVENETEVQNPKQMHTKIILLGFVLFAFVFGMAVRAYTPLAENQAPHMNQAPAVVTPDTTTLPTPEPGQPRGAPVALPEEPIRQDKTGTTLSPTDYEAEEQYYLALAARTNPRTALEKLREQVETDPALLRSCHAITHSVGQAAYVHYQDFTIAMQYLDDVCNTGYMHGVIEAKFKRSDDIAHDMLTICNSHSEGRCFHGVGHGLMFYTDNDLPRSIAFCETLPKLSSKQYCAEGVFMENFNTDQKTHPSNFLSNTDFFYPCAGQSGRYKNVCYYYAPLHYLAAHTNAYSEGLAWCNTAEETGVIPCVRGVAAVAIKQNITKPALVEAACMTALPKQIPYCIDGMTGIYINHYNSLDKAYAMCKTLQPQNQKACTAGVKSREATFETEVL